MRRGLLIAAPLCAVTACASDDPPRPRVVDRLSGALVTGALSTDAARGSDAPFDPRIHSLRRHQGQIDAAEALRQLMAGSPIRASHLIGDERVQDPYCLRCQPQVMGAVIDLLRQAMTTLGTEANGVTDNPLILAETEEALSGGNFHGEPVAFAADLIALAICEIGSLAERRIAMLVDPALSGLPAFLTPRDPRRRFGAGSSSLIEPSPTAPPARARRENRVWGPRGRYAGRRRAPRPARPGRCCRRTSSLPAADLDALVAYVASLK